MEVKQRKQTKRFSKITAVSDNFLSLDDKFKERHQVKFNNIQGFVL